MLDSPKKTPSSPAVNPHLILHSQPLLHKLTNIFYKGILSGDLGVHIGVYQAQSITPFQKFE
ncbi:MAG: hypothetical protein P8L36_18000, partial [SAR324 cluster bacterium]|nr:hypothetical protein [SAR324 cluster bacterium]